DSSRRHRIRPLDLRARPGRLRRRAEGGDPRMTEPRPRVYVYRGGIPLWLVLAVAAPLGMLVLTSLVLAIAVIGVAGSLAALLLPWCWNRRSVTGPTMGAERDRTIELDRSQYRRVESRPPRNPQ